MMQIGDETLMAYADGELHGIRRAEVERALAGDPDLQRRLEAQQQLRARLSSHYAPVVEEPVPDRFAAMIRASAAGNDNQTNVADLAAERSKRRPLTAWQNLAALAATFVLALVLGQVMPPLFKVEVRSGDGPVAVADGTIVARGELDSALRQQLAADQGETRIGVSFAAADGRYCRTFENPSLSGLACAGDKGWEMVATAPGTRAGGGSAGEYRQASSGNALVLATAQEMMAGDPLDAAGERRAREMGWYRHPRD
jgi:hypothetical protein